MFEKNNNSCLRVNVNVGHIHKMIPVHHCVMHAIVTNSCLFSQENSVVFVAMFDMFSALFCSSVMFILYLIGRFLMTCFILISRNDRKCIVKPLI